ncbi:MAG: hypothetical protein JNL92_09575 [Opitutaceae bacterium]|nr:hypothetical protein [Opitutaceae bacterium]
MKFLLPLSRPRSPQRSVLLDLHAFGHLHVFRRHSLFRLWEPLRETWRRAETFSG